jgi:hypothetical protein
MELLRIISGLRTTHYEFIGLIHDNNDQFIHKQQSFI